MAARPVEQARRAVPADIVKCRTAPSSARSTTTDSPPNSKVWKSPERYVAQVAYQLQLLRKIACCSRSKNSASR